jgi:hypothetical protein
VTDEILKQQWKGKLKLKEVVLVPNSQDSVEEDPDMIFQEGYVVWHERSG